MSPLNISLADLIARLDEELPDADDLARISEAQLRNQTLADLGDQLVDHYVGKAKRAGASWSEVGEAIGVSKQAAQQRHAPGPFERFTDLNRHSIVLAQEAARTHKHDFIGTEHILLGLLGEPRGLAYEVLMAKTESEQRIRDAIVEAMPPAGQKALRGHIAFRPESKEALDQASRASADLGHDWVGTEHSLLGLIRIEESPAAQILRNLGFTSDELHETVRTEITRRSAARDT
ncbi:MULTISPECIES: Clp protease N-terminal domain-containing protein [Thermomonosporaceae]|uniref:Clp protease N-terminal domain-containing protein n=1 Tax=Thermomonosporaceae TaxID=2012 RepID=UPI00255A8F2A|nr:MULTISPECIES: Clp protease N-terminal domain-containing protein [Thermomonosporaceae]MDL4775805.1 Clp protease N-terminal domain-containing protein [Actinomadura xylanilytica]